MNEAQKLTADEAAHEVKLTARRIALLHLAFSRTAIRHLGEEDGRLLISDAIKLYGTMVGKEVRQAVRRQGLEPIPSNYGIGESRSLPNIGMHEGAETVEENGRTVLRAHGCVMAEVWKEYGGEDLGRLYCLVDPAKYMSYNPAYTLSHAKAMPSGDPYCEFCVRETSLQEQADFASETADWTYIDCCPDEKSSA